MNSVANRFPKKNEHGFTLVELLIALLLLSALVLSVSALLAGLPRFYLELRGEEEEEEVWTALNFMARELRSAKRFHGDSTAKQLILMDENEQEITYRYNAGNKRLERQVKTEEATEPWYPIIDNIQDGDWEITYYTGDKNNPARFLQITLELKKKAITIQPRMYRGEGPDSDGWFK